MTVPQTVPGRRADTADTRDEAVEAAVTDDEGARIRREVLGDAYVDRGGSAFAAPFREYVTGTAWGQVWSRPGLDRRTRSCLTIALLAALRCEEELALHVRTLGILADDRVGKALAQQRKA